jgi:hypothetical protein
MRCMDRSHENAITMATSQNCSHRSRIRMQRAYVFNRVACLALRSCDEKFLNKSYGSIAFEHEIREVPVLLKVRSVPS